MAGESGYMGKILRIDLSAGEDGITTIPTSKYADQWLSGRGIASKILWDEVAPETKTLDPENYLMFFPGMLAGLMGSRTTVMAVTQWKWPVEGSARSNFSGHWGAELKFAGYDGLIVTGKADAPVYVYIENDQVHIYDATTLWGMGTYETQMNLWSRYGDDTRVACIGQAGENLVVWSTIVTGDSHVTGQGGMGAVMGSKNLKAIAIKGTNEIKVARPEELMDIRWKLQRQSTRRVGEKEPQHASTSKFEHGKFPISQENEAGTARVGRNACFGCPVGCGTAVKLIDGTEIGGGGMVCDERMVTDYNIDRTWFKLLRLHDEYGISVLLYDWYINFMLGHNALTNEEIGIPYEPHTWDWYKTLMRKVALREDGFGNKIAGVIQNYLLVDRKGDADAEHIYKLRTAQSLDGIHQCPLTWNHTPKNYGWAGMLGALTSNMGTYNDVRLYYQYHAVYLPDTVKKPNLVTGKYQEDQYYDYNSVDNAYFEFVRNKSKHLFGNENSIEDNWQLKVNESTIPLIMRHQNDHMWWDTLGYCYFDGWQSRTAMYSPEINYISDTTYPRQFFNAVTGKNMTYEHEFEYCQRLYNLERAINVRQGHRRKDDLWNDLQFELRNNSVTGDDLNLALDRYYEARGMDAKSGLPRRSILESLGLKDVADDLEKKYRIALPA